jgi:hypothetical protein
METSTRLNEAKIKDALKDFPSLQELFGPLDYCECNPDRSVLSPAAYFVDLLQFLTKAADTAGGIVLPDTAGEKPRERHGLTALLQRRPDIVDLELSPTNTESELPYIDLVLELLENAVALPLAIEVPGVDADGALNDAASGKSKLPKEIIEALQATSLDQVGDDLVVTRGPDDFTTDPADTWIIADQQRRWTLRNQIGGVIVCDSEKPRRSARMPGSGIDGKEMVNELDHGRLPAAIRTQIETVQKQNNKWRFLSISNYSVLPVNSGKQWKINCRIGAKVIARV